MGCLVFEHLGVRIVGIQKLKLCFRLKTPDSLHCWRHWGTGKGLQRAIHEIGIAERTATKFGQTFGFHVTLTINEYVCDTFIIAMTRAIFPHY